MSNVTSFEASGISVFCEALLPVTAIFLFFWKIARNTDETDNREVITLKQTQVLHVLLKLEFILKDDGRGANWSLKISLVKQRPMGLG